jgi:hypothetical protein
VIPFTSVREEDKDPTEQWFTFKLGFLKYKLVLLMDGRQSADDYVLVPMVNRDVPVKNLSCNMIKVTVHQAQWCKYRMMRIIKA